MPVPKFLGDRPPAPGARQVPSLPTSKVEPAPIQTDRHFRCGRHPDATVHNQIGGAINHALAFRTKEIATVGNILGNAAGLPVSSAGAGSRARYRFAFHTSPYHHALFCRAIMYPQSSGYTSDAYARLSIFSDAAETTEVTAARNDFHYGGNPLQSANITGWQHLKIVDKYSEGLTADTTYYARVDDVDNGLIQSLCVGDLQSMTEGLGGYLPQSMTSETPILDSYRQQLIAPLSPMWKRGGSKVLNWSVDSQASPRTITSATPTNLINGTDTTYGASIPGYTLVTTGKARLSQLTTGVPIRMVVWGKSSTDGKGRVYLKDSAGATICAITDGWSTGTGAWQTVTGLLPVSASAKYYLVYDDNSSTGTLSIGAVSIYEYET